MTTDREFVRERLTLDGQLAAEGFRNDLFDNLNSWSRDNGSLLLALAGA